MALDDTGNTKIIKKSATDKHQASTFWLTRIVFLRCLAFVYAVAFAVAFFQNKALIGQNGILPLSAFMDRVRDHFKVSKTYPKLEQFLRVPTLFWYVREEYTDIFLDIFAIVGLVLSTAVMLQGAANMFIMFSLWGLYQSIVNVGQRWYSFGWESQLLETGFLGIWLVPVFTIKPIPVNTPTSRIFIYGCRWLLFRIMLGAGLIKIRGDDCWRQLTCMNYHYETQPVPNPLSWFLHHLPSEWHQLEVLGNHVVELMLPWLLLIPQRTVVAFAGTGQILFQVIIIISGNFSFLNWLTILPAIFCFDDSHVSALFTASTQHLAKITEKISKKHMKRPKRYQRAMLNAMIGGLLIFLSIPVIQNLLSSSQQMNTSFDSFRLVNTYGAFGSITKVRTEVIIEGTTALNLKGSNIRWKEYEFKCKPGAVTRNPCIISPYHYRLDWLMWFAAFQNYQHNPWFISFVGKLLEGDSAVRDLISHDPFRNSSKLPTYIRAQHYRYKYTPLLTQNKQYWDRKYIRPYMPPVSLTHLKSYREENGWIRKIKPVKVNDFIKKIEFPKASMIVLGLLFVMILLMLKLFGREMDLYYEQSMGNEDEEIERIISNATPLESRGESTKPKTE